MNIHAVTAMVCGCLPIYKRLLASAVELVGTFITAFRLRLSTSRTAKPEDGSHILQEIEIRRQSLQSPGADSRETLDVFHWQSGSDNKFSGV